MGRRGEGLKAQVVELAIDGGVVTYDQAVAAIFGSGATRRERQRIRFAVENAKRKGELLAGPRGSFKAAGMTTPEPEAEDLAAEVDVPRRASAGAEVHRRIDRAFMRLNEAAEELSELRHALGVAERFEDSRPSFPMRCMGPGEREP